MTFTFSNNEAVDYPSLGMCDTCGKRFTHGCEHSNTLEAQQWLAAYVATEQNRDNVEYFLRVTEETRAHPVNEAEAANFTDDPRTPAQIAADEAWQDELNTRRDIWQGFGY